MANSRFKKCTELSGGGVIKLKRRKSRIDLTSEVRGETAAIPQRQASLADSSSHFLFFGRHCLL
jgi:hypothetical protein